MKDFRLRLLRTEKHFTQRKLAIDFNMEQSTVSEYENKVRIPDIDTMEKICDYFDVSLDFLIGRTEIRNIINKDLSPDETNHIYLYRKLDTSLKEKLNAYLQGLLDAKNSK